MSTTAPKTFVRRNKKTADDNSRPHDIAKARDVLKTPAPDTAVKDQASWSSVTSSPDTISAETESPESAWGGWERMNRTFNRRSSLVLPVDGLLQALTQLQPGRQSKKQREARVKEVQELVNEMCGYFAEVDAFELAVESGSESEEDKKPASKAKNKKKTRDSKSRTSAPVPGSHPTSVAGPSVSSSIAAAADDMAEVQHTPMRMSMPPPLDSLTPATALEASALKEPSSATSEASARDSCDPCAGSLGSQSLASNTPSTSGTTGRSEVHESELELAAKALAVSRRSSVLILPGLAPTLPGRRSSVAVHGDAPLAAHVAPMLGRTRRSSMAMPAEAAAPATSRRSSSVILSEAGHNGPSLEPTANEYAATAATPAPQAPSDAKAARGHKRGQVGEGRRSSASAMPVGDGGGGLLSSSQQLPMSESEAHAVKAALVLDTLLEDEEVEEEAHAVKAALLLDTLLEDEEVEEEAHAVKAALLLDTLLEEEEMEEEEEEEEAALLPSSVGESGQASVPGLEAQDEEEEEESNVVSEKSLTPMQQLLKICDQSTDVSEIPSMDALLSAQAELKRMSKIGEGTYGEAFKYNRTVFKIVPIEGSVAVNGTAQKQAGEMGAEALISLTLSRLRDPDSEYTRGKNVTNGFAETFKVGVCHGPYSKDLIKAWKKWDKAHESENDDVSKLPPDQLYIVVAMMDSGRDLEKVAVASFNQARSLLAQVAFTLAVAEEAVEYEHRDLHWGNVLVRPADSSRATYTLRGVTIEVETHGATASLIDFTASRLCTPNGAVAFCDLSQDPELFEGPKGKIQFDTYRWMRKLVDDKWASACPATNCLWMAYLAEIMAAEKSKAFTTTQKRQLREFRKRAAQMDSCRKLVFDELFSGLWVSKS